MLLEVVAVACATCCLDGIVNHRLHTAQNTGCEVALAGGVHARAKLLNRSIDRVLANGVKGAGVNDTTTAGPLGNVVADVAHGTQQHIVASKLGVVRHGLEAAHQWLTFQWLDAHGTQSTSGLISKPGTLTQIE